MIGVLLNAIAIILGSILGVVIKKGINNDVSDGVIKAVGLVVIFMGIKSALVGEEILICLISIAIGTTIGTLLDLDTKVKNIALMLKNTIHKLVPSISSNEKFEAGFIDATVIFVAGAMAVIGSINAGLKGDISILGIKSLMDGITATMLSSVYGIGVMFSAISVFIYQGLIVLLSRFLSFLLYNDKMMAEFTCIGNILIMAIGINLATNAKIKIMNMVPSIFIVLIVYTILMQFGIV